MKLDKGLASENRLTQALIPLILLVTADTIAYNSIDSVTSWLAALMLILANAILILLVIKGYLAYDIYYDENNMYLKGSRGIKTIPFADVKRVKMTLSNAKVLGMQFHRYRIEFLNRKRGLSEIDFWILMGGSSIEEFECGVRQKNQNLVVEHWATS